MLRQRHRYIPQSQGHLAQSRAEAQRLLYRTEVHWYGCFLYKRIVRITFNLLVTSIYIYRTSPADQRDQVRHTTVVSGNEYLPSHNMAVQVNRIAINNHSA